MASRSLRLVRFLLIALLFTSLVAGVATEEVEPQPEASPDAAKPDAAAEPEPVEEVPLNCKSPELLEPIETWTVDCVAKWLENMEFPELKAAFLGNKIDGPQLKTISMAQLSEEYGVSDETQQKKLIYAIKDIVKKDNYEGNTNNWAQFLMWLLPVAAGYYYFTLRYERQIGRLTKKYRKWQEARNPPEPAPLRVNADGTNEWIEGVNADVSGAPASKKKEKKTKKVQ